MMSILARLNPFTRSDSPLPAGQAVLSGRRSLFYGFSQLLIGALKTRPGLFCFFTILSVFALAQPAIAQTAGQMWSEFWSDPAGYIGYGYQNNLVAQASAPIAEWGVAALDATFSMGQLEVCIVCPVLMQITNFGADFSRAMYDYLVAPTHFIIIFALAFMVLFNAAKAFLPFGSSLDGGGWNSIFIKALIASFVFAVVQKGSTFIWSYFITPVLGLSLVIGGVMLPGSSTVSPSEADLSALGVYPQIVTESFPHGHLRTDHCGGPAVATGDDIHSQYKSMANAVLCPIEITSKAIGSYGGALYTIMRNRSFRAEANPLELTLQPFIFLFHVLIMAALFLGLYFVLLRFTASFMDVIFKIMILAAFAPFLLAAAIFDSTRKLFMEGVWGVVRSGVHFIFSCLALLIFLLQLSFAFAKIVSYADSGCAGSGSTYFKVINIANNACQVYEGTLLTYQPFWYGVVSVLLGIFLLGYFRQFGDQLFDALSGGAGKLGGGFFGKAVGTAAGAAGVGVGGAVIGTRMAASTTLPVVGGVVGGAAGLAGSGIQKTASLFRNRGSGGGGAAAAGQQQNQTPPGGAQAAPSPSAGSGANSEQGGQGAPRPAPANPRQAPLGGTGPSNASSTIDSSGSSSRNVGDGSKSTGDLKLNQDKNKNNT